MLEKCKNDKCEYYKNEGCREDPTCICTQKGGDPMAGKAKSKKKAVKKKPKADKATC